MVRRALFIGRFQPIHLGHLEIIKRILEDYDEVVVGIGSAQEDYTLKNPFTLNERQSFIRQALKDHNLEEDRVRIVEMPDIPTNSAWASYATGLCPEFEILWTGSPFVSLLFRDAGARVKDHELIDRERLSGTEIRDRMLAGGAWQELVTGGVVELINKIKGIERLKTIVSSDNPYKPSH